MSNVQLMRLKGIQNEYLQHTDKTEEEAKNIARLMSNINKRNEPSVIHRKFLDLLTVIKYMEADHDFASKHGMSHLAEVLIEFVVVCHKQSYGKKLIHAVSVKLMQFLTRLEQMCAVIYTEGKKNEKSIAYPNGLSANMQNKIYELYKQTDIFAKQLVRYLVNTTFALEVGHLGASPLDASLQKWVSFSPEAVEAINKYKMGLHKGSFIYMNDVGEKIESSRKGNYNITHIEAGYNEMAREPSFREPNLIERGLSKLLSFRKG